MARTRSLDTLIKLEGQAIDEQQKHLKALRDELDMIADEIAQKKETLRKEAIIARESVDLLYAYSKISEIIHQQLEVLEERKKNVEIRVEEELDILRELFANKKRLEIIKQNKIEKEKKEIEEKKQKEIADLVMSKYTISLNDES